MEDENTKEENQPSTSKKESGNDLYDDERDERGSNSETSVSASYSARSRIDMADARPEVPKAPPTAKREREPKVAKPTRRQRTKRGPGRVEKRRRSFARRHVRRIPRRKHRVKDDRKEERRDLSVSTIFTRFSSRSGSRAPGCIHCGHRCCRRRYYSSARSRRYKARRYQRRRKIVKGRLKKKPVVKNLEPSRISGSEQVQVGSRTAMLSPLFIKTTNELTAEVVLEERRNHCEVSPQMIYNGLRKLSVWRQHIMTGQLMYYIQSKYPVDPSQETLYQELKEKLRVAAIVGDVYCSPWMFAIPKLLKEVNMLPGLVVETIEDHWSLSSALQRRHLTVNHVTAFWRAYADTMRPIRDNRPQLFQATYVDKETAAAIHKEEPGEHYGDSI